MIGHEEKFPRGLPNGDGDNRTGRYVPLHELQEKYGKLYGASEQESILPKAILAKATPTGEDKKRLRNKKGDTAVVKAKAADLIRGFEPFGFECLNDSAPTGHRNFVQVKQESVMHDAFIAALCELRPLATEVDLTFQSVKSFSSGPRTSYSAGSAPPAPAPVVDEIMLDVELLKVGGTHSVIFRAPQSWELYQPGAIKRPHKIFGARPKTMHEGTGWMTSTWGKYSAPAKHNPIGDSVHTLNVELSERLPEEIVLRRCGQQDRPLSALSQSAGRTSPDGVSGQYTRALAVLPASSCNAPVSAPSGDCGAAAEQLDLQGKSLEKNFNEKLLAQYHQLSTDRLPPPPTSVQGPTAAAAYAAASAATASRLRIRANDYTKEYIRQIRSALGLLGPALPAAARVIEGAVKGLIVALDMSLSAGWQQVQQLQRRITGGEDADQDARMGAQRMHELERENAELKEALASTEHRNRDESNLYRERIEQYKKEIERLSPDQADIEGVAGLMGEYSNLMQEMLEEGAKQTVIMDKMAVYTKNVVGDASAAPEERARVAHGRVIELMNGELLLRAHDVEHQGTQVSEADLNTVNPELPVRLRMPRIRLIMCACASQNVAPTTLEELEADIDSIYNAKMQADQDADQAGLPRSELADFVVEFFLESLGSVEKAQSKFCSILRFLQAAERNSLLLPLRVTLFQRFLEFCEYVQALPLTVLSLVLQAKRFSTVQLQRQKANAREMNSVAVTAQRSVGRSETGDVGANVSKEPQLGVALAYEAAMKALPHTVPAMRAFFAGLSGRAEVDSSQKSPVERDLLVLFLLLHDRMYKEGAHALHELVQRAEQRGVVSADEFREGIRDAKVTAIGDAVWRNKLADPSCPGQLSTELLLDFLGGGSPGRLPGATISESGFMVALTEGIAADYEERLKHVEGLWKVQAQQLGTNGALTYSHFESVIHSEEPTMPAPMLRSLFLTAVELSRSCSQFNGDPCLVQGTLEPVQDQYGGDVVTFPLFALGALRRGLFLKDSTSAEAQEKIHAQGLGSAAPSRQASAAPSRPALPSAPGSSRRAMAAVKTTASRK